jgi:hypothetical protein
MNPETLKRYMDASPFRALADNNGVPTGHVLTCPVRVGFLAIDRLYENKKYPSRGAEATAVLIVPPSADISPLVNECRRLASAHFGAALNGTVSANDPMTGQTVQVPVKNLLKMPFKSQADKKGKPGFTSDGSGHWFRASTKFIPRVISANKQPIPADSPELYAGMWCIALLRLYAYPKIVKEVNGQTIFGIGLGLDQLQKIGDDDRLVSASSNADAFADLSAFGGATGGSLAGAAMPAAAGSDW